MQLNENDLKAQIDKLSKLSEDKFIVELMKESTSPRVIAYFAAQEQGQGNVIKRWYAKAELIHRESIAQNNQIKWAMISAIASAIASICALISILIK